VKTRLVNPGNYARHRTDQQAAEKLLGSIPFESREAAEDLSPGRKKV